MHSYIRYHNHARLAPSYGFLIRPTEPKPVVVTYFSHRPNILSTPRRVSPVGIDQFIPLSRPACS